MTETEIRKSKLITGCIGDESRVEEEEEEEEDAGNRGGGGEWDDDKLCH